jgi:hypothetical protein
LPVAALPDEPLRTRPDFAGQPDEGDPMDRAPAGPRMSNDEAPSPADLDASLWFG